MAAAVTYSFTALTNAQAAQVNRNFQDVVDYLNNQVILKDASVAFTAIPSGPASDPTSPNQLTRKAYVDRERGYWRQKTGAQTLGAGANDVTLGTGVGATSLFIDSGNTIVNTSGKTLWVFALGSVYSTTAQAFANSTRGCQLVVGAVAVGYNVHYLPVGGGNGVIYQSVGFFELANGGSVKLQYIHSDSVTHTLPISSYNQLAVFAMSDG